MPRPAHRRLVSGGDGLADRACPGAPASEPTRRGAARGLRGLSEWLRVCSADEEADELPDHAGTETGRKVLHILLKWRVDLTDGGEQVIRRVVDRIHAERGADLEPNAGQENWRHV